MYTEEEDISLHIDTDRDSQRYSIDFRTTSLGSNSNRHVNNVNYLNTSFLYTPKSSTRSMLSIGTNREVMTDSFMLSTSMTSGRQESANNNFNNEEDFTSEYEDDATEIDAMVNNDNEVMQDECSLSEYDSDIDSDDTMSDSNDTFVTTDDECDDAHVNTDSTVLSNTSTFVTVCNSKGPVVQISKLDFSILSQKQKPPVHHKPPQQQQQQKNVEGRIEYHQKSEVKPEIKGCEWSDSSQHVQKVPVAATQQATSNSGSNTPRHLLATSSTQSIYTATDRSTSFSMTPKKKGLYSSYKSMTFSSTDAAWMQRAYTPRLTVATTTTELTPRSHFPTDSFDIIDKREPVPLSPRIVIPQQQQPQQQQHSRIRGFSLPEKMIPYNIPSTPIERQISNMTSSSITSTTDGTGISLGENRSWSMQSMDDISTDASRSLKHLSKTLTDLIQDNTSNTGSASDGQKTPLSSRSDSVSLGELTESTERLSNSVKERVELAAHYLSVASKQISEDRHSLNEERKKTGLLQAELSYYQKEAEKYERLKQLYTRQSIESEYVDKKLSHMKQQLQVALDSQKRMEMQNREMQIEMSRIAIELRECREDIDRQRKTKCCCVM